MAEAVIVGGTGLVGSRIVAALLSSSTFNCVHAFTRRPLPVSSPKLSNIDNLDPVSWPSGFPSLSGQLAFFSGLGTTRAAAGGFANQRKIDYELNLELAKAAKAAGIQTYVLISSAGSSSKSLTGYAKMKGELEDAVKELGFEHCVILQPGLLMGKRDEMRIPELIAQKAADFIGMFGKGWVESWAQDVGVIGRAAVRAAEACVKGEKEKGVWVVGITEINKLGKEE
ncbi:NAD dependent epimerase/dehydratase family protein-like protein [Trichodelitschia bisporula]|uniref:NAD dependent epimerase/dehydratase family protein-like protein n=1 Tax=Trichodelitschia bisporula TaxID=703511 RepID=A0A6G1I9U0_9PEZI|nr:NAD dependent epimerase/dehydratase family protein-like protein [Trichodelitschia bisporula]